MAEDRRIIHEITPLMGKDVLYIADRHKKEFTYPIHNHSVFELNFVENAAGVKRIVGDSQEVIGDFDLCLITSPDLEHVWEQNVCRSEDIREITIQFDFSMGEETLFGRNPYASITRMMQEAKKGLCFPLKAIMKVYRLLDTLSTVKDGFYAVQQFLTILYELSKCENARTLASSSYAKVAVEDDSRRILKVKNYISKNYMDELRLPDLASLAGMSSSAFSRFFKRSIRAETSRSILSTSVWAMPPECWWIQPKASVRLGSTAVSITSVTSIASSRRRRGARQVSSERTIIRPELSYKIRTT